MAKKTHTEKSRVRGAMKALTMREVQTIQSRLFTGKHWRDLALFRTGIDTMFRASDLVRVWLDEVLDHQGKVVPRAEIRMKKTGKPVKIALTGETREAIDMWLAERPSFAGPWLFPGRDPAEHLSEVQYRRLAKDWFKMAGLDVRLYSTHSIRRTKAAEVYRQTHNLEAVRRLLGHTKNDVTSRYLGIEDEDALSLAEKVKI
jgi:integrase